MAKQKKSITDLVKKTKSTTSTKEENDNIDVKSKEKINKLLEEVDQGILKKDEDIIMVDEDKKSSSKSNSNDWLEEQVSKLSDDNERLRIETAEAKENYRKLFEQYENLKSGGQGVKSELIPDSLMKNKIIDLFTEFQNNFIGRNQERKRYTQINLQHLMQKFIKNFSFLNDYKM